MRLHDYNEGKTADMGCLSKIRTLAIVSLISLSLSASMRSPALAQETTDPNEAASDVLTKVDASETVTISAGKCLVVVTSDKDALVQDVDTLRTSGLLNSSYDDNYFLNNPSMLIITMGFEASSLATLALFSDNPNVKKCHFQEFMTWADDYGNQKNEMLYSYDFDKALWSKINWDKFNSGNLPRVGEKYSETPMMEGLQVLAMGGQDNQ